MSATGVNDVLNSATLQAPITTLQEQVEAHFARHPDAEIILSQPGLGSIARVRASRVSWRQDSLMWSQRAALWHDTIIRRGVGASLCRTP
jgi:hypothetical protein